MDDLQQLHRELDVADAAPAALDLDEVLAALADVLLEPNLRPPDLVDRRGLEMRGIDGRGDAVDEGVAEREVARRRPRLQHRLALPHGRPALVVRERGVERAAQRAGATARPQREVDAQRDALVGGLRQDGGSATPPRVSAVLGAARRRDG